MNIVIKPPPDGWGTDEFTKYIDKVRENQFATFTKYKNLIDKLNQLDFVFRNLIHDSMDLRPYFPAKFLLRAHSAYLVAYANAMAAQLYEIHSILRTCLELAAHGLYISSNERRTEIWLKRSDSETAMQEMKKEFRIKNIKQYIADLNPDVAGRFSKLYQYTIDFGGHPNPDGILSNIEIVENEERIELSIIYLDDNPRRIENALVLTGQVGIWALTAAQLLWPDRFESLRLSEKLKKAKNTFDPNIREFSSD